MTEIDDIHEEGDAFRDECGVFGIFGKPDAAAVVTLGLHALQHRGQEAAGIAAYDGKQFFVERHVGLIGDTFTKQAVLRGSTATARSAIRATRPPAARACATSSRFSPNSPTADSRSPTTATSPTR